MTRRSAATRRPRPILLVRCTRTEPFFTLCLLGGSRRTSSRRRSLFMRRLVPGIIATVAVTGLALPLAAPAHAATTLKFARFYADQPGADTPYTTTKLNRE